MDTYLITYKLKDTASQIALENKLKEYPKWALVMENVWIVKSEKNLTEVRDDVTSISEVCTVLVVKINNGAWGTYAVDKRVTDWMKINV